MRELVCGIHSVDSGRLTILGFLDGTCSQIKMINSGEMYRNTTWLGMYEKVSDEPL